MLHAQPPLCLSSYEFEQMIPSVEVRKQNFQLLFSETGHCGGTLTLEEIRKAPVVLIGSNNPASAGFAVVPRPSRGLASIPFVFHLQPAAAKLKNSKVSDVSGSVSGSARQDKPSPPSLDLKNVAQGE